MDINAIINFKRPKETYYDILGCSQSSDVNQINKEYKIRALLLHPDKNGDPESLEKFRQLQNAKDVLTNPGSRKKYDIWLNSGINMPFEQFQNRKTHAFHWATPRPNKLSIQGGADKGQGSDMTANDHAEGFPREQDSSLVEKFRNYEI